LPFDNVSVVIEPEKMTFLVKRVTASFAKFIISRLNEENSFHRCRLAGFFLYSGARLQI
jgi:c-di-GMP-related signal transduction protein